MNHFRVLQSVTLLLGLFYLIFPQIAYAYLDLGTGSYIFQVLLAAFISMIYAVKIYWSKIKGFFSNHTLEVQKKDERDNI